MMMKRAEVKRKLLYNGQNTGDVDQLKRKVILEEIVSTHRTANNEIQIKEKADLDPLLIDKTHSPKIQDQEEIKVNQINSTGIDKNQSQKEQQELREKLNLLTQKILTALNVLQEEHRIFKRPFIVNGMDYIEHLREEIQTLEIEFKEKYIYLEDTNK